MLKKAMIFLADGFEEIEAITVINVLRRAKVDVLMVSAANDNVVHGSRGIDVVADVVLVELNEESIRAYDMFIMPGGLQGSMSLADNSCVKESLVQADAMKKYVAAICAAPYVLGVAGLLKGRNYTCFPGMQEKIDDGRYVADSDFVVDGNIATSRGPGTAMDFALGLVSLLCSKEVLDSVKNEMLLGDI